MMPASFMNDRVGPICRTVEDAARVLDVIAGYDPKDELTAFSVGRKPDAAIRELRARGRPRRAFASVCVREYMDKRLFTPADAESIDIVDRACRRSAQARRRRSWTRAQAARCFRRASRSTHPHVHQALFVKQYPELFPVDAPASRRRSCAAAGRAVLRLSASFRTARRIRGLGPGQTLGDRKIRAESLPARARRREHQEHRRPDREVEFLHSRGRLPGQEGDARQPQSRRRRST